MDWIRQQILRGIKLHYSKENVLILSIILAALSPVVGNYFLTKWTILVIGVLVYTALSLKPNIILTPILFLFIARNIYDANFGNNNPYIDEMAAHLSYLFFLTIPILFVNNEKLKWLLGFLAISNVFLIIIYRIVFFFVNLKYPANIPNENLWLSGIVKNPAMNCALLAVCLPFIPVGKAFPPKRVIHKIGLASFYIGLLMCYASGSTTAIISVSLMFVVLWFGLFKIDPYKNLPIITAVSCLVFYFGKDLLNGTNRIPLWKMYYKFFNEHCNPWLGCGAGSFYVFGPELQKDYILLNNPNEKLLQVWAWLHSDIYQVFFEYGGIFCALFLVLIICCVIKARKNINLLAAILAYIPMLVLYYPVHFPVHVMVGAILVKLALYPNEHTQTAQ